MEVKKYLGKIADSNTEIIGYLIEQRESLGNGCYSDKKQYLIYVTECSMPKSTIRGGFIVKKESIKEFLACAVCNINQAQEKFFNSAFSDKCYSEL